MHFSSCLVQEGIIKLILLRNIFHSFPKKERRVEGVKQHLQDLSLPLCPMPVLHPFK